MAVKMYNSTQVGAPSLTGQTGSAIALFDACLVNGYGAFTVSNITRSGNVATVACAGAHNLTTGDSAALSGANEAEYNAEFVVTVVDTLTFTIPVTSSFAATASGSLAGKRAGGGFSAPFVSENGFRKVYRSNDLTSRRFFYQLNDDASAFTLGAITCSMYGFETCVGVDYGEGRFPAQGFLSLGCFMHKSVTADATARAWVLITDGKTVHWFVYGSLGASGLMGTSGDPLQLSFGDLKAPGDPYAAFVAGTNLQALANSGSAHNAGAFQTGTSSPNVLSASAAMAITRRAGGCGSSYAMGIWGCGDIPSGTKAVLGNNAQLPAPLSTQMMTCCPVRVAEQDAVTGTCKIYRGIIPGVYESWMGNNMTINRRYANFKGLEGRTLYTIVVRSSTGVYGVVLMDLTGPWS